MPALNVDAAYTHDSTSPLIWLTIPSSTKNACWWPPSPQSCTETEVTELGVTCTRAKRNARLPLSSLLQCPRKAEPSRSFDHNREIHFGTRAGAGIPISAKMLGRDPSLFPTLCHKADLGINRDVGRNRKNGLLGRLSTELS